MRDSEQAVLDHLGSNGFLELEDVGCLFGCERADDVVLVGRDLLHGLPGEFPVVRCRTCGLARTNPRPSRSSIGNYYPHEYEPHVISENASDFTKQASPVQKWIHRQAREFVRDDIVPDLLPGQLLEIGCAAGSFLARKRSEGWQVQGIETSERATRFAQSQGLDVFQGSIEDAPNPQIPYDLVCAWMVVEHLHDPVASLTRVAGWMKPGGWIAVSTPNIDSIDFKMYRELGFALQVPTHLFHFTPATLSRVLEAAGFQVKEVFHQRTEANLILGLAEVMKARYPSIRLGHWLADYHRSSKYVRYALLLVAAALGAFGQSGRMTIWAQRG